MVAGILSGCLFGPGCPTIYLRMTGQIGNLPESFLKVMVWLLLVECCQLSDGVKGGFAVFLKEMVRNGREHFFRGNISFEDLHP